MAIPSMRSRIRGSTMAERRGSRASRSLNSLVARADSSLVEDAPAPDGVVGKNKRSGPCELQRELQILRVALLVRVYEDEIEGLDAILGHDREQFTCVANSYLYLS